MNKLDSPTSQQILVIVANSTWLHYTYIHGNVMNGRQLGEARGLFTHTCSNDDIE